MSTTHQWQEFFAKNKIDCNTSNLAMPPKQAGTSMLVIVPSALSNIAVCELFKRTLGTFGLVPFIAPISRGSPDGSWEKITLDDKVPHHERSTQGGSYAHWVRPHVSEDSGELILAGRFDHDMTLTEAFLYHLFFMDMCGQPYIDLHFDAYHTCTGSKCDNGRPPSLQWDLQDIKVVLRS